MYVTKWDSAVPLGALPKWLTPPQSVRDLVKGIVGAVVSSTSVTIPTPSGPQVFNVGNAADLEALRRIISGAKLNVPPPPPIGTTRQLGINEVVRSSVPGGWLTIAAVGLGLAVMLGRKGK
jgi:hypothetical protein